MIGFLPEYVLEVSPDCLPFFSAIQSRKFPFPEKKFATGIAMEDSGRSRCRIAVSMYLKGAMEMARLEAEAHLESRFGAVDGERQTNWLPLVIAVVLVAGVVTAALIMSGRKPAINVTSTTAGADPYATSLPLTGLAMSESANLAGGKVTYLDGHIANLGDRTVTGVTVQVLFRNYNHEVAQNETLPLTLIRTREPYVDTEAVSASPLKPGAEKDFRLIFDSLTADWAGGTPEIRVLRVDSHP